MVTIYCFKVKNKKQNDDQIKVIQKVLTSRSRDKKKEEVIRSLEQKRLIKLC